MAQSGTTKNGAAKLAILLVGLAVALLLLPVVGVGWGLWVIVTAIARRGTDRAPGSGRVALGALSVVASICLGAALYPAVFADRPPTTTVPAFALATTPPAVLRTAQPAPVVVVPDVVGQKLPSADSAVRAAELRSESADASPLARNIFDRGNWTVIATNPPAGTSVPAKRSVSLLVLKNGEAAWFAAHPTMPKLRKGMPADELTDDGGPLAGLRELVLLRYAKGKAPKDALTPDEHPGLRDGFEPAEELAARAGLKDAYWFDSKVVGSIPAAGQEVRPGRFAVVTVEREKRRDPPAGSDGGSVPIPRLPDNDDDDDVNIPGWLCPTRFC